MKQKNLTPFLFDLIGIFAVLSLIACVRARAFQQDANSAFKYREVYLPEGIGKNANQLGLNSLEEDWGIWGHNIRKILPAEHSESVYAKVNGTTHKNQFCFSSPRLFDYVSEFIDVRFDDTETIRFAILPNDNDIVCLCAKCVAAGNTKKNASPAVFNFINKLSERFPNHIFYTSDYRTTTGLPSDSLPGNTGVIISAISYPLNPNQTPQEQKFINRINDWSENTHRILVWDYINNFDDYFTPYPVFGAMQRRLQDYRDNHVSAIFLNGSGTDYSAMSDIKAEVLALLTADPDINWRDSLVSKARKQYPVAGQLIADFMLAQEDFVAERNANLPFYEGVEAALTTYLPEETFIEFHDNLKKIAPTTSGTERKNLQILLGELALTRLELMRINSNLRDSEIYMADLHNLVDSNIDSYNESGWTVSEYLRNYDYLLQHAKSVGNSNKLKGQPLIAMTPLDPEYSNLSIVTDGVLGIPSNYHSGNLIISPENYTKIAVPRVSGLKKLKVWMVYNPAYKIGLPESVALFVGNKQVKTLTPEYPKDGSGHSMVEFDIPGNVDGSLVVALYKNPEFRSIAIDEIEGF